MCWLQHLGHSWMLLLIPLTIQNTNPSCSACAVARDIGLQLAAFLEHHHSVSSKTWVRLDDLVTWIVGDICQVYATQLNGGGSSTSSTNSPLTSVPHLSNSSSPFRQRSSAAAAASYLLSKQYTEPVLTAAGSCALGLFKIQVTTVATSANRPSMIKTICDQTIWEAAECVCMWVYVR